MEEKLAENLKRMSGFSLFRGLMKEKGLHIPEEAFKEYLPTIKYDMKFSGN